MVSVLPLPILELTPGTNSSVTFTKPDMTLVRNKMEILPKINTECKFKVWLVETSPRSTTNPMSLKTAKKMIKDRKSKGLI